MVTASGNSLLSVSNDFPVTMIVMPASPETGERIRTGEGTTVVIVVIVAVGALTVIALSTESSSANSTEPIALTVRRTV
jgi:hypothetical protein